MFCVSRIRIFWLFSAQKKTRIIREIFPLLVSTTILKMSNEENMWGSAVHIAKAPNIELVRMTIQ